MSNSAQFKSSQDDVFARIATRYDVLCDIFSFGIHRLWKQRVAETIAAQPWQYLFDGATGTGDIAWRILDSKLIEHNQALQKYKAQQPTSHYTSNPNSIHYIIAADISTNMLNMAKIKLHKFDNHPSVDVQYMLADACDMPQVADASQDVYSLSLALKICERDKVLQEAYRVLKPNGRLVILEASNIPIGWLHRVYLLYMSLVTPIIGYLATGGDGSAYRYLLAGVKNFPTAEALQQEIQNHGFINVTFERLSFGIMAIHCAHKPA